MTLQGYDADIFQFVNVHAGQLAVHEEEKNPTSGWGLERNNRTTNVEKIKLERVVKTIQP